MTYLTWCPECGRDLHEVGYKTCPECDDEICLWCYRDHMLNEHDKLVAPGENVDPDEE